MNTKKSNATATATAKTPFVFTLPNRGVDKVDFHELSGEIKTDKGITSATAKSWFVRVRKDGAWQSAFKFASDYVAANNQDITADMRKALREVSGVYANKSIANVAAFTMMTAFGLDITPERKASADRACDEVEKLARELEKRTIAREAKAVKGGKTRFCEDARDKAGKQFDKLEKSFKARSAAIQAKALKAVK